MSRCARGATLWQPHPDEVALVDARPREIILQLAEGFTVELWPGDDDHPQQLAWIEATIARLHQARDLMATQHPGEKQ